VVLDQMDTTVGLAVDHTDQAPVVGPMDMALMEGPHPAEEPSVWVVLDQMDTTVGLAVGPMDQAPILGFWLEY